MNGTRQLLLVLGCVVCLVAVASALPAADPRVSPPGADPGAGEWDTIDDQPDFDTGPTDDAEFTPGDSDPGQTDDPGSGDGIDDPSVEIRGGIEPGNEVLVDLDSDVPREEDVLVNGEYAGETESGELEVVVPYEEQMTIDVPGKDFERTFEIETDAAVESEGGAVPSGEIGISAVVGSTPVENATVFVDGEHAGATDADGTATVTLPETTGSTEIRIERGPVEGTQVVEIVEPEVEFVSPLLFPGSPAPVHVSADGAGVPNATVEVESGGPIPVDGGGEATTDEDGTATVWLPVGDEATVTVTAGEETATASAGNLYLRLGALVVIVPGFAIGLVVTYLRIVAAFERRGWTPAEGVSIGCTRLLVDLASVFGTLPDVVANASWRFGTVSGILGAFTGSLSGAGRGLGRIAVPSLPRIGTSNRSDGGGLPSLGLGSALASFGSVLGSLSALGSIGGSSRRAGRSLFGSSSISDWRRSRDSEEPSTTSQDAKDPALASEPLGPPAPSAEIRGAWHAFLDRVEIRNRETLTPGRAARRALGVGFPADHVARLVSIFRAVEYGGREPSPERVAQAQWTAAELAEYEPDDEDGPGDDATGEGST